MDWQIDKNGLAGYKSPVWNEDKFIETKDNKYGIYLYNIEEEGMGAYYCNFALLTDRFNPTIFVNSLQNRIYYPNGIFDYLSGLECLIIKKIILNPVTHKPDLPFLLLRLKDKKFGFIQSDLSSIYYKLVECGLDSVRLIEELPTNLKRFTNRTGETFKFNELQWFDLKYFDNSDKYYRKILK
jgi:hypothetical protein